MNFLDNIVIPPGTEHAALLNVLQILTLLIFLPFTGMILGGAAISAFYNTKGKKENNPLLTIFAKDIMHKLLVKRSVGYAFGVLPIATVTIIYAQFLFNAKIITVNFLMFSTLFYFFAFVFLYRYKNSFYKNIPKSKVLQFFRFTPKEVINDGELISFIPSKSGYAYLGIFSLIVGLFLFVCGTTAVTNTEKWFSSAMPQYIFALPVWANYFYLIFASFSIAGGAILYLFFVWQGGIKNISEEYSKLIKNSVIPASLITSIIQPFFLFGGIVLMPANALSATVYVQTVLALISILIVCNLLYVILKNSEIRFAGAVFFIMFITFTFAIVKDQLVLGNSVKEHLAGVFVKAEDMDKQKSTLIISNTGIDAEQIFNQKCNACHKFDVKLVGPPYQETIPKYNGDVKKLSEFIYNPVKVNPDYPAMPNQGLKKKEADAMAQWLLNKVGKK